MTNPTPHGQVPEALRIADEFRECLEWDTIPSIIDIEDAADELRRLHAENERLAAMVEAQQPAPSAASKAVLAAIRAANMQLVRTGDDEFMLVTYKNAKAQCDGGKCGIGGYCDDCPTPQADSQPAPVEVADAMADSQYLAGVSAGWNAANADDPNAALQKLRESRAGYLKPLSAARAMADSVREDAARWQWLADYLIGERTDLDEGIVACATIDALRQFADAARKQGANHDNS